MQCLWNIKYKYFNNVIMAQIKILHLLLIIALYFHYLIQSKVLDYLVNHLDHLVNLIIFKAN